MLQTPAYALSQIMTTAAVQSGTFVKASATFFERPGDPSQRVNSMGQVQLTSQTPVAGLEDLPCLFSPAVPTRPNQGDTKRTTPQWDTSTEFHLLLQGAYPAVLQRYLVQINGGKFYEVMGVETDSQQVMTRCAVRAWTI